MTQESKEEVGVSFYLSDEKMDELFALLRNHSENLPEGNAIFYLYFSQRKKENGTIGIQTHFGQQLHLNLYDCLAFLGRLECMFLSMKSQINEEMKRVNKKESVNGEIKK